MSSDRTIRIFPPDYCIPFNLYFLVSDVVPDNAVHTMIYGTVSCPFVPTYFFVVVDDDGRFLLFYIK